MLFTKGIKGRVDSGKFAFHKFQLSHSQHALPVTTKYMLYMNGTFTDYPKYKQTI